MTYLAHAAEPTRSETRDPGEQLTMRNMSFALTTDQVKARQKTVTRRLGWRFAKPGMVVRAVKKCMGLRPGETIEPLATARFKDVRREPLDAIDAADVEREGFPGMTPAAFVAMFCEHMGATPQTEVTRIEFEYVD